MKKISIHLLTFSLVFPLERIATILLVLFFIFEFFFLVREKKLTVSKKLIYHPIIILFLSTIIFDNLNNNYFIWDKYLTFLLLPTYFHLKKLKTTDRINILKFFVWYLFLSVCLMIINEFYAQFFLNDYVNLWKLKEHYSGLKLFYFTHSISERMQFHHIYLSLYVFFGFVIGHYLIYKKKLKTNLELVTTRVSIISFFFFLLFSLSRMSIICLLIYGIGFIIFENRKRNRIKIVITILLVAIFVATVFKFDALRFNKILKDPRIKLIEITLNLSKESIFFGYGSQNSSINLIKEQQKISGIKYYNNPHNQFLSYLLKGGLVMLVIFIIVLTLLLKQNYKSKSFISLIIIFFFIFQCLTESLLDRYRGIVLFSFFASLFYNSDIRNY